MYRRALTAALALACTLGPAFAPAPAEAQQRTRLTVYTALENEQLAPLKAAAEAAVRDIEIAWVRDSTGVITARLIAERQNPRADIIWGVVGLLAAADGKPGDAGALHAAGRRGAAVEYPLRPQPDDLDRHGRLRLGHLLQHRGGERSATCRARPPGRTC